MPNLKTTVNKGLSLYTCPKNIREVLKEKDPKSFVTLQDIHEAYGIEDTLWFLECFEYPEYCDLLANILHDVLPFYEKSYADGKARAVVEAMRAYKKGDISERELFTRSEKAYSAYTKAYGYISEVREGAIRAEIAFNKKHNITHISNSPPSISTEVMDIIDEATKAGDAAFVISIAASPVNATAIASHVLDIMETYDWISIENHVVNFINS